MTKQPFSLELGDQRKLLGLCVALCASVSADNLARRGDSLHSTLVDPFVIRELADLVDRIAPDAVQGVRDQMAARRIAAAEAARRRARERAELLDAERRALPTDQHATRALPKHR